MNLLMVLIFLLSGCEKEEIDINSKPTSIFDRGQVWFVSEFPNPCPDCVWPHKITFSNDTIINSLTYKKVIDFRDGENESESIAHDLGFLRETDDKKVYWYISLFGKPAEEILIYDFNANVNDTIDNYWIVTNIDSVNVMGIKRKRVSVKNCASYENQWIEGVGDLSCLLSYSSRPICSFDANIVGMISGDSRYRLNCVEKKSILIYQNAKYNNCWTFKGSMKNKTNTNTQNKKLGK